MTRPLDTPWSKRQEKRRFGFNAPAYQVYEARQRGEAAHYEALRFGRKTGNPYPPGTRHEAWADAFAHADPMGEYMGRNE